MSRRPFALAALCAASTCLTAQAPPTLPDDRAPGAAEITADAMRGWLTQLTSEAMAGRGTGEPGFRLAAELVRYHFKAMGLEPARGDDFLMPVPWVRRAIDPDQTLLRVEKDGKTVWELTVANGLKASAADDSKVPSAPLGIAVYRGDHEGFASLDATGANVIVLAEQPIESLETYYAISKSLRGAGMKLVAVVDAKFGERLSPVGRSSPAGPNARAAAGRTLKPRVFAFKPEWAEAMLVNAGTSRAAVLAKEETYVPVYGATVTAAVVTREEPAPAYNVAGIVRGSDPKLRDEYVIVGSHLDHLGARGDTYCPGADDDGSGTVAVMAMAQAFAKSPQKPKRSVLFVTFCGEEMGLLGSAQFAEDPPVPLASVVAELQVDMIGRSEENKQTGETADQNRNCLHLIGSRKLSEDLHAVCLRINDARGKFDLEYDEEDVFYRSDHFNFARRGVPVAFFFTGFHRDYHQPSDTLDKIEFAKLERVARYVYDVAFELAQAEYRPLVEPGKWEKLDQKGSREPAAPLRK